MDVPQTIIDAWRPNKFTGVDFGNMSNAQLETLGLLGNPLIVHFRDRTHFYMYKNLF